ncbi:MAG TPA: methionyl-tRNA formyltransferase [Vicinamibacterales bacterium]|nr:methionyl-tRNA formyltransferase [Vicinamibacterales bacterium]
MTSSTLASLRIVFFGTPRFALTTLEALLRSRHQVVGVVTQPDKPRGRGQMTSSAPVKAHASDVGLPIFQPEKLKDPLFSSSLAKLDGQLGVVAAYGRILPDVVLTAFPLGLINVHASLLPKYRGAAPVHRAVIAGEIETGVTIMRVVKALDAGPMFARVTRPIGPSETSDDVERDLAHLGADLLVEVADSIAAGTSVETAQNESEATYASRLTKEDGIVDWSWPAERIHNLIRGLHPWPHAFSYLKGRRVILHRSLVVAALASPRPGTIVDLGADRLIIATGKGSIQIEEIQAEGRRPMSAREFLAGHRLSIGEMFSSPTEPWTKDQGRTENQGRTKDQGPGTRDE